MNNRILPPAPGARDSQLFATRLPCNSQRSLTTTTAISWFSQWPI